MIDFEAISVSLMLGLATAATLVVITPPIAAWLTSRRSWVGRVGQALSMLPLVIPPTVLGLILVAGLSPASPVGRVLGSVGMESPLFTFPGIWLAACIASLPLALQPMLVAFGGIDDDVLAATKLCGASRIETFLLVQVPLAGPGIVTGAALAFAHAVGQFGVIMMVGGDIPGVTRTASVSIYNGVQSADYGSAGATAAGVTVVSGALVVAALVIGGTANQTRGSK